MRASMIVAAAMVAAVPARIGSAQAQPAAIWPTRDVTVVFGMGVAPPDAGDRSATLAFSAATKKGRMEMGAKAVGIVDYEAGKMTMLMPEQQKYMVMEAPEPMRLSNKLEQFTFTRVGNRTVAGTSCTDWRVKSKTDPDIENITCLTSDGVMLRSERARDQKLMMEAREVRYGRVDPALFEVPAGYTKLDIPGMPPGGMPPPGARPPRP